MGGANWGSGFATGMAAGRAGANPQYQHSVDYSGAYYDERNARRETEKNLMDYYALFVAMREQRNLLVAELAKFDPQNALISPKAPNSKYISLTLKKASDDVQESILTTGLATDQELRSFTPLLAAEFDENQKKLAEERKKQEEARMKALEKEYLSEMKAAGGGMFSRLLGSRPTGFPEFKDWLVQKGHVKPAGQDQANGVEQKG